MDTLVSNLNFFGRGTVLLKYWVTATTKKPNKQKNKIESETREIYLLCWSNARFLELVLELLMWFLVICCLVCFGGALACEGE